MTTRTAWDASDAEALYNLLEREVVPEFYTRDEQGIPNAWITRMRESMARLTPRFSTNRTVGEYTERYYLPRAAAYLQRAAAKGKIGASHHRLATFARPKLGPIHFGELKVETSGDRHVFEVAVVSRRTRSGCGVRRALRQRLQRRKARAAGDAACPPIGRRRGRLRLHRDSTATRPPTDYTPRVIPCCAGVAVPLEDARILWQR